MSNYALPKIIRFVGIALAIPAAMIIGSWAGAGKMRDLAMLMGLAVACFFFFGIPKWLWLLAVGSLFLPGQLPFIPLPFKPSEIFLIMAITYFLIYNVIFRKQGFKLGPAPDSFCLIGLFIVLLFHGFGDRFAMRLFGSDTWGGRSYVTLIIAFVSYFILQSNALHINTIKNLPFISVCLGFFDFLFNGLAYVAPSLAGSLDMLYFTGATLGSSGVFSQRLGFAGNFGYLLLLWSLSTCKIQDFFFRGRFFMSSIFFTGILLCFISGYRSTLIIMVLIIGLAAFRDLGFTASFLILPAAIGLSFLIALQSAGFHLPVTIQRGLVLIPGVDWDQSAKVDARGSNEFRGEVWRLWYENQFPRHPILGRGFGIDFEDMIATLPFMSDESGGYTGSARMFAKYSRDEAFVVSGNIHNGFLSTIDRFGIVGICMFVVWIFVALSRMVKELIRSRQSSYLDPPIQWIILYVLAFTIGFPLGALKIEQFLPNQLLLCGLFIAMLRAKRIDSYKLLNGKNKSIE